MFKYFGNRTDLDTGKEWELWADLERRRIHIRKPRPYPRRIWALWDVLDRAFFAEEQGELKRRRFLRSRKQGNQ